MSFQSKSARRKWSSLPAASPASAKKRPMLANSASNARPTCSNVLATRRCTSLPSVTMNSIERRPTSIAQWPSATACERSHSKKSPIELDGANAGDGDAGARWCAIASSLCPAPKSNENTSTSPRSSSSRPPGSPRRALPAARISFATSSPLASGMRSRPGNRPAARSRSAVTGKRGSPPARRRLTPSSGRKLERFPSGISTVSSGALTLSAAMAMAISPSPSGITRMGAPGSSLRLTPFTIAVTEWLDEIAIWRSRSSRWPETGRPAASRRRSELVCVVAAVAGPPARLAATRVVCHSSAAGLCARCSITGPPAPPSRTAYSSRPPRTNAGQPSTSARPPSDDHAALDALDAECSRSSHSAPVPRSMAAITASGSPPPSTVRATVTVETAAGCASAPVSRVQRGVAVA